MNDDRDITHCSLFQIPEIANSLIDAGVMDTLRGIVIPITSVGCAAEQIAGAVGRASLGLHSSLFAATQLCRSIP